MAQDQAQPPSPGPGDPLWPGFCPPFWPPTCSFLTSVYLALGNCTILFGTYAHKDLLVSKHASALLHHETRGSPSRPGKLPSHAGCWSLLWQHCQPPSIIGLPYCITKCRSVYVLPPPQQSGRGLYLCLAPNKCSVINY